LFITLYMRNLLNIDKIYSDVTNTKQFEVE